MQSLTGSISTFLDALTQPPVDSSATPAQRTHSSPADTSVQAGNTVKPMAELNDSDSVPQTKDSGMVQASSHTASHHVKQATPPTGGQSVACRTKSSHAVPSTQQSMSVQTAAAAGTTAAQNLAAVKGVPMQPSVPASDRPQGVGRVVVESLGGLQWQLEGSDRDVERHLYTAVFQLKAAIRDSRCAAMVSFPAGEHQHLAEEASALALHASMSLQGLSALALHASMSLQGLSACPNASPVAAGLYSPSLTMRLAHLCDTVVGLEAVRDDSDIVRLIPEPARYCLLLHSPEHKSQSARMFTFGVVRH